MPVITDNWRGVPVIKEVTAERGNIYYREDGKVMPLITEMTAK